LNSEASVVIGYNHIVRGIALKKSEDSVFYEIKGKSNQGMEHLEILKNRGVGLVGQDEEGSFTYSNFNDFLKFRPEFSNLDIFDSFFAWGERDYLEMRKKFTTNIKKTGSPRTIFWGAFGEQYFEEEILKRKNLFGSHVLVLTGFTIINSVTSRRQNIGMLRSQNYYDTYINDFRERQIWEKDAFGKTISAIKQILKHTDLNVFIRPHPVENIHTWENIFSGNERVIVGKNGSSTPAILAAEHVIHLGSTAGFESIVCGKPTTSLEGLLDYEIPAMTSNLHSKQIKTLDDLIDNISESASIKNLHQEIIDLITYRNDTKVLKDQAETILNISYQKSINLDNFYQKNKNSEDKTSGSIEKISKAIKRIKYGKNPVQKLHEHKRPKIDHQEVSYDLKRIQKLLNYESNFQIKELGESTFQVFPV
jgi:surface carbohydrate biosynthesis protein